MIAVETRLSKQMTFEEEVAKHLKAVNVVRDSAISEHVACNVKMEKKVREIEEANVLIQEASKELEARQVDASTTRAKVQVVRNKP